MNLNDFTSILQNPGTVTTDTTPSLEAIVNEFPYFQSARALHLKGLYNQDSFKYNQALKITAAHSTDRTVLFDFITSEYFAAADTELSTPEEEAPAVPAIKEEPLELKISPIEASILESIKEAALHAVPAEKIPEQQIIAEPVLESDIDQPTVDLMAIPPEPTPEFNLGIGKPLDFSNDEKHSFQEWLQLSHLKPIERHTTPENPAPTVEPVIKIDPERQKKKELIDKFIETNPKIVSVKNATPAVSLNERINSESSYLMTETLAKVYLEQKKYQKAIQAYEILILKYPEKNAFFADRILDIKILQQNNN
ncbi:hypothetical protein FK004_00630 [Flavobacterium kingsejongi]|uniref:Tetratricopeptide repeat protein n=1 Tax=Flavobacterium kingsejongi TaxID=1678728 RepID=A0A2S1LTY9_9FLAO|nr:tetratricopeptide repeat protein [Flavobacterium kingsejongi]AWG27217.1 hypothetical protein FK004_00630 [Flavobacterium kingsejongi]